jgi:protein-tyrosine phosphatase
MTEHQTQPILENLWWVIPGKLAGVRKPAPEEIAELKAAGIRAIISVMDDPSNLDLYQQAKIHHLWLPITGGTAPNRDQIEQLRYFVAQQKRLGNVVAVHRTSGRRRTGTLLAAYLISEGSSYEDAIQTVLLANSNVDLREAQISFLQVLAKDEVP